jgi:hypothetical protein
VATSASPVLAELTGEGFRTEVRTANTARRSGISRPLGHAVLSARLVQRFDHTSGHARAFGLERCAAE